MGNTQTATEPINPLAGQLQIVAVHDSKSATGAREVEGAPVAPGLAITPSQSERHRNGRYCVTHLPSGLIVGRPCCGQHVQDVAAIAVRSGIDWNLEKNPLIEALRAVDGLMDQLAYRCSEWCVGDGPEPPSYGVHCHTCDWEWEDEYDEGPLTREQARQMAGNHECQPEVLIQSPVTGKWHPDWQLKSAEADAADVTAEQAGATRG